MPQVQHIQKAAVLEDRRGCSCGVCRLSCRHLHRPGRCSRMGTSPDAAPLGLPRLRFLGGNGTAGLMTCYNGFRNQKPSLSVVSVMD